MASEVQCRDYWAERQLRITAISSFEFCRKTAGAVAGVVGIEGGAVSGVIHLESSGLVRRTADHVMKSITWKSDSSQPAAETAVYLFDDRLVHSKLACAIGWVNSSKN